MTACMEGAANKNARTECKDTTTKQAMATALGRETSDITATELNRFVDAAAQDQVRPCECCSTTHLIKLMIR
jgi:uroporphyrinogen-III decarboxylase